jgi:hypothetical protein
MKGREDGDGPRVLLSLRAGRAEVRDDLLLEYLLGRLSPVLNEAVRERAVIDRKVRNRIEELRAQLLGFAAELSSLPDESLPRDWRELLRRVGSDKA